MPAAATPPDEPERLAALRFLGFDPATADGFRPPAFDRAVRLVKAVFGGVDAAVTLIDGQQQFAFAGASPGCAVSPRRDAFCAHTLLQDEVIWAPDTRADPRFADSAMTCEEGRRFYAGAPIRAGGRRLGALCAFGREPRAFDAAQATALAEAAALLSEALDLRLAQDALMAVETTRRQVQAESDTLLDLPVALAFLDRDLRITRCSRQWIADYLGEGAPSPVGRTMGELLPGAAQFTPVFLRAAGGEVIRGETPFPAPDGSLRHKRYECAQTRDATGAPSGLSVTSFDVTELVDARMAAERTEERLKLALTLSDLVIWEVDLQARRVDMQGAVERLFGGQPTYEQTVERWRDYVHPEDLPRFEAAWANALATGGDPEPIECRMLRLDNAYAWVDLVGHIDRGPDGAPRRIVGRLMDAHARRTARSALEAAAAASEAASRAKSEFLANMSHELRTPLNGVMGVAGALARTPLGDDQRDMVALIEGSARTLERLLSDVLDLARIESRAFDLTLEPLDVGGFVRGVGTLFQWRARDKGLRFDCRADPGLEGLRLADETRLRQILSNLLSNAIKFTEHGRVDLCVRAEGEAVVFQVADTGIGFTPEAAARLFERFEQADGSITRRYGGTGLGLAISRSLAERMGGSLEARGAPDKGACFTLRLPLARAGGATRAAMPAGPQAPAAAALAARIAIPRVLLAEDHPVNRRVVELILGDAVELTSVENGALALEALATQEFDLVLMDVQMPVMDGLAATRALRAREAATAGLRRTPVLALTANAAAEHVAASRAAGADEHLAKPVTAERLLDAIRRLAAPPTAPARAPALKAG